MSSTIRIGTRDSELALWQAQTVQNQLEYLGHKTTLVPIKSTGDLVLDKPLYQMGITGIFTKALDIAMLNGDIDIAVHSLKDVPTVLPQGIVQAAVLKRGKFSDVLVFKDNEEFLAQPNAVVATGSLRRKAQWLNRYPSHQVVGLRGNVNSRLEKLESNHWNGAIFAGAGLERIGLKPENTISLGWMVPAPGQGTIMITALGNNPEVLEACAALNDSETEICTTIERRFLNLLEGGCTAPIGALAYIKDEEINFKGVLLSEDGSKKIEVSKTVPLGRHKHLASDCAKKVLDKGGKRIMAEIGQEKGQAANIYSTKALSEGQKELFNPSVRVADSDFIKISINRIPNIRLQFPVQNAIITSQNAVESLVSNFSPEELKFKNIYCVGRRTKRLIEQKIGPVTHVERNAKKLAQYLVEYMEGTEATYFCSNLRLDEIPAKLTENNITLNEIEAYTTKLDPVALDSDIEGVLFYSPSTVQSYMAKNSGDKIAFCIGETTAKEAAKHFNDVRIAKVPTVESVIELVNNNYV